MASYSDDRGATWTEAVQGHDPDDPPTVADSAAAERIAVVAAGPHTGRLVAAGLSGITVSDDGGDTWHATSEWAYFRQSADCIAALRGQAPGGGDRLVTVMNDIRILDDSVRVIVSDDGGDTWRRGQGLFPGTFRTCVEVVDLGDGRAAAVMLRGPIWWTEDAGETWSRWAEWTEVMPEVVNGYVSARWAIVGPDGRLYVGTMLNSPNAHLYDRRTSVPVAAWAVGAEGVPEPESDVGLAVYPNPTGGTATIRIETAEPDAVRVSVVDVRGRRVAEVYAGRLAAGVRQWDMETDGWASGVYVVRVEGGGRVTTARFTVAR